MYSQLQVRLYRRNGNKVILLDYLAQQQAHMCISCVSSNKFNISSPFFYVLCVVGTANPATSRRKMRSPPAAIFVWGVHPETTIEDIVNDLAESDIKIDVKDVEKKSKDEAYLVSYKITKQF